jgi:hypothetical protein
MVKLVRHLLHLKSYASSQNQERAAGAHRRACMAHVPEPGRDRSGYAAAFLTGFTQMSAFWQKCAKKPHRCTDRMELELP